MWLAPLERIVATSHSLMLLSGMDKRPTSEQRDTCNLLPSPTPTTKS
jgi:hypothetical protein